MATVVLLYSSVSFLVGIIISFQGGKTVVKSHYKAICCQNVPVTRPASGVEKRGKGAVQGEKRGKTRHVQTRLCVGIRTTCSVTMDGYNALILQIDQ